MLIPGTPQGYDFFQFVGDDAHIVQKRKFALFACGESER